jgi:cytochrome c-type protein NapB
MKAIQYLLSALLTLAVVVSFGVTYAQDSVSGLRGEVHMEDSSPAPSTFKQDVPAQGFGRAYRQQPPLIPHRIDGYQVTKNFNKCMDCHDWPNNTRVDAPKISETHYRNRDGAALDQVAGTRWFCNQCHVPQVDAPSLVENTFRNATQVD